MNTAPLADDEVDTLTCYADGEARLRAARGIGYDELRELALNRGVERCPSCRWWAEAHEMLHPVTDEIDGHCSNCR